MAKSIICSNIWLPLLLVLGLYGAISIKHVSGQEEVPTETTTLVPLAVDPSSSSSSPVPDTSSESSPVDGAAKPDESALVEPVVLGKPSQEQPPSSSDKKPEDTDKSKDEKDNEDENGGDDEEERIPKVYIIHHHGPGSYRPSATPSNSFPPIPRPSYFPSHSHHNHHQQHPHHTHSQSSPFGSPFLSQSPIFQRNPSPVYIPSPFNGGGGSWNPQMIPRRPLQNRPPLPQFQPPQPQQPPSRFDPLGQFDDSEKKRQFYQDMLVTQLNYFKDKIEPMMDKEDNITKKNDMEELLMTVQDLKQTLEHHQIFNISEIMDNWKRGKLDPVDQSNEESEVESSGGDEESNDPKPEKPNEKPEDGDRMIQSESETSSTGKPKPKKRKPSPPLIRTVIIMPHQQSLSSPVSDPGPTTSYLPPQSRHPSSVYDSLFRRPLQPQPQHQLDQQSQYSSPYGPQQSFVGFSTIGQHRTGLGGSGYGGLSLQPQFNPEQNRQNDNFMRKVIGFY